MNRIVAFIAVVFVVTTSFSADNQWDGNNFGYNGSFGLTNGSSPDWSTSADIWTIRTPSTNDTSSGNLGYLSLLNAESTAITVTNSFTGKIVMNNFGSPVGPAAITVTNRIFSFDTGVTVTGASSDSAEGTTAAPSVALEITFPNGDVITLEEGTYTGGAGKQGLLMTGAPIGNPGILNVQGASILGSNGESYDETGAGSITFGSVGLQQTGGQLIIDSQQRETDVIRGGNGGDDLFGISIGTAAADGGDGIFRFLFISDLIIEDGLVRGGNGGNIKSTGALGFQLSGGYGLNNNSGVNTLKNGVISGGNAGTADINNINDSSVASGGIGVNLGSGTSDSFIGTLEISGGNGGTVITPGAANSLNISGGHGLNLADVASVLTINGANISGGNGGTLDANGSLGVLAGGGMGLLFDGAGPDSGSKLNISGGTYTGGSGGIIVDPTGGADISGGRAVLIANGVTSLVGGNAVFNGGQAGSLNGALGEQGVAFEIQDANVIITNGSFNGRKGFLSSSVGGSNSIAILGGTFGDVEFSGVDESISVTGGSFNEFLISGSGSKNLILSGTTSVDRVRITAGDITVSEWNDSNFVDTTVSNGVLNFNNQNFNVLNGDSFALLSQNAQANFNGGAVVHSGGSLSVGSGQVGGTNNFIAKVGSSLFTTYGDDGAGGVENGQIKGDNLTFEQGLIWTLENDGSVTNSANLLNGFVLAMGTSSITQDLATADIILNGNPEWRLGITGVTNFNDGGMEVLRADYGALAIEDALNAEGEFGKAMEDFNKIVETDPALAAYIGAWTEAEAQVNLHESYVRTPEVASALIGLQSVFADQIKDRTSTFKQLNGFGLSDSRAPNGAAGPEDWYDNSVDWTRERLPRWGGGEGSAASGKAHASGYSGKGGEYESLMGSLNEAASGAVPEEIEVPTTYQIWGRAYGSQLDQKSTTGHVGYDAAIGGAMIGMDKRYEKALAGIGAGFAQTTINGNLGNDAEADTGHVVGYFSTSREQLYFDANINYAMNSVDTEGLAAVGYEGEYDAHTVGFYVGAGLGIPCFNNAVLFTPEVSLLSTFYSRESYTEKSDLGLGFPDKDYDSYDEWSYLSALGATLSMIKHIESFNLELEFQPELRAHWLHEFNAEMDDESYKMAGVPGGGQDINVELQAREEDLLKLGGGVRFSKWDSDITEFGLDIDGVIGQDYSAFIVSGKLMHRF